MTRRHPLLIDDFPHFLHGGDYNPDQWLHEPAVIDEDFRLFPLAGCNAFSVGIFAWTALEPREGEFRFGWLADILDRMAAAGHKVILATPSGAKPTWLALAEPEVRRVSRQSLQRDPQRSRHNHCPTSPVYRAAVARIDTELAKRFGDHPAVAMWHLSNEYNGECACQLCQDAFRDWLRARYGDLEHLNRAWWTAFWSHGYGDWSEISPVDISIDGLELDWRRFVTAQSVDFMRHEIATVRAHSDRPVTTNLMGRYPSLDYWRLVEHLDLVTNDSYPQYHGRDNRAVAAGVSLTDDMLRAMGGGRPWLQMECTPSATNGMAVPKLKRPGQHRLEMLQAIAHGADGTCYFQWRKGRGGREKFHGAVVDHAGAEHTRVFGEVAAHGQTLRKLEPVLGAGADPEVALVYDWESWWALTVSCGPTNDKSRKASNEKGYRQVAEGWYRACWERGLPVDVIERRCDLSAYKLVVLPMGYLVDAAFAERLRAFVAEGGALLATCLTGWVDTSNRCHRGGWPGAGLRELFGVWAEELDALYPKDEQSLVAADALPGLAGSWPVEMFAERVHAEGAEVLATYGAQFYAGEPALTVRAHGQGHAYYLAARVADPCRDALVDALLARHGLRALVPERLPAGVTVQERRQPDARYLFALNFNTDERPVRLHPGAYHDLETGEAIPPDVTLPAYGARVLKRPASTA